MTKLRYGATVLLVVLAWWLSKHLSPALITLIGLLIIVGATIWFVGSVMKKHDDVEKDARSWLRLVWDGFWGL